MGVRKGADRAESLCSVLEMQREEEVVWLWIAQYGDSSPESEASSLGLALLFSSQVSEKVLRKILHRFHQLRHFTDTSLEYSECVNALFSWLASLPDLKRLELVVSCLTEIWATRILKLIHTCPSLKNVRKRCCKATEPCTEFKDTILSCNELWEITMGREEEEDREEDEEEREEEEGEEDREEEEEMTAEEQHNQQQKKKKRRKKKDCVLM
ncbi:uncharacterized protein LOC143139643 [Alosa pseudoharengus]|uniref:uncharacterized protein LOC143139643 n=1 Tax=Alosa pseudoharengus TaxID=34774 RepID=UPI003F8CBE65